MMFCETHPWGFVMMEKQNSAACDLPHAVRSWLCVGSLPLIAAALFLILFLGLTGDVLGQDTTRIMLLGDSITSGFVGSDPLGGFRDDLYYSLISVGGVFDFVGTLNDGVGFDADHEGHGGYYGRVYIINSEIDSYLVATDPQMVLIHLGTNNINSGDIPLSDTMIQFNELLEDHIFTFNPNMTVFLSGIIPRTDDKDSVTTELNSLLFDLVQQERGIGRDIKYVDHNSAFKANANWQADYMIDNIHPNNAGYAVMAGVYFDSLASEDIYDSVSPAAINDLVVDNVSARTALLRWTATGDDGTGGTATSYDIRYSKLPITDGNFELASQAVGEPAPLTSGSAEEFSVGGLDPDTFYYFAIKATDEAQNSSPMSVVPSGKTTIYPSLSDDFERVEIGSYWNVDPDFILNNGELSNESLLDQWDFVAVYNRVTNNTFVSLHWGSNADSSGIGEGGLALMMDSASPDANGYLIFRHSSLNSYQLYEIIDGAPSGIALGSSPESTTPFPQAGDEFSVVTSSDVHGFHFDCYINGVFDTRVSDPLKVEGAADTLWAGVMLHGNRNNNAEDFQVSGSNANVAPDTFSLLSPIDADTVDTGTPLLDWEDAVDQNPSDSLLYSVFYGTSAGFDPDSTTTVDSLRVSEYRIPVERLISMLCNAEKTHFRIGPPSFEEGKRIPDRGGEIPICERNVGGGKGYAPLTLTDDAVIYWKVKASDSYGLETMSLEQGWSFVVFIPDPPLPFGLLSPGDGDTVNTLMPTLTWEPSSDPDTGDEITYTLYCDTDTLFSNPLVISGIGGTSFSTPALPDSTLHFWKVEAVDRYGLSTESSDVYSFFVLAGVGIGDEPSQPGLPRAFALSQNYPNPFNPSTSIRYDIPGTSSSGMQDVHTMIQIFNTRGQLVRTLVDGTMGPGSYVVQWDGRSDAGEPAGSGIYLYRIQAGAFSAIRKMIVLK